MSVHYKFKSSKDYDTVTFEGSVISVADLKKEIIRQQKLTKANDFDLEITNAQTREEFKEEGCLIPKNTSVIVKRVPASRPQQHYVTKPQTEGSFAFVPTHGESRGEEDKIQDFLNASVGGYSSTDNKNASRVPNRYNDNKIPPPNYLCHRCNRPGHFIHNCPTNGDPAYDFHKVKKATGIPRAFLKPVEAQSAGSNDAMMIPGGGIVVMQPNSREFDKIKKKLNSQNEENQIPEDLTCPICKSLIRDAVLSPCCANTFCDQCIRRKLLENLNLTCPTCNRSNCSPQALVANLKIRSMVEKFKHESRIKQTSPTPGSSGMVSPPLPQQTQIPIGTQPSSMNQNQNQNHPHSSVGPSSSSVSGGHPLQHYPSSNSVSQSSNSSYGQTQHQNGSHLHSSQQPSHHHHQDHHTQNRYQQNGQSGLHSHHHSGPPSHSNSNSHVNSHSSSYPDSRQTSHHSTSSSNYHHGPVRSSYRDRDDRYSSSKSYRHDPYGSSSRSQHPPSQRRGGDRDRDRDRDQRDSSSRRDKRPYNSQSEWEVPVTESW